MTCVNDNSKNNFLNNINVDPLQKEYNTSRKKKNKNKNDMKLFIYNKNYDIYNNIMNNNYPNIYSINNNKFMEKYDRFTKIKNSDPKNKNELFIKPKKNINCIIENEKYYSEMLKNYLNRENKNKPLEKRKQSISGLFIY